MNFFRKHKLAGILIGIPTVLLFLLLLLFAIITAIPLFERIDNRAVPGTASWMESLDDETLISEVVLPGTHDSCSAYVSLPFFSRCQALKIDEQLESGFRFLDIRLELDKKTGKMLLMHGFTHCRNGIMPWSGNLELESVLEQCYEFLEKHPTEFIIFSVKQEHGSESTESFERTMNAYAESRPEYWLLTDSIVSVGEARGKLVLMRRYADKLMLGKGSGISFIWADQKNRDDTGLAESSYDNGTYTLLVQDRFKYDPDDKWSAFLSTLEAARENADENRLFVNYLSTNGNTAYGHPYKYAKPLNSRFMSDSTTGLKGWLIVDFGTSEIAEKIYSENSK